MNIAALPGRERLGGRLLLAMLALSVSAGLDLTPLWWAGLCAWLAGACLWHRAGTAQRRQFAVLVGVGLACTLAGWVLGQVPSPGRLLAQNQGLLGLLCAVTFLRLVALPETADRVERAPAGPRGYLQTLLGLHLFGAVINLSALVIMGDRLHARAPLGRDQAVLLSRGFSSAAFWSPFFAAMATALTYAPGARLATLLLLGIPLSLCALGIALVEARQRSADRLAGFRGYPLRPESLRLPLLLALAVILGHHLLPGWSVLTLISLLAPGLVAAILWLRGGPRRAARELADHVDRGLPGMFGELLLFIAAGVLGAGLILLGAALRGDLPPLALGPAGLSLALLAMVAAALLGVHPVVSIAAVAAIAGPQADPTPLAVVFLAGWGIGAAGGPLTGIHLLIQGRYGISAFRMMRWNLGYTLAMTLVALGLVNLWPIWTNSVQAL